MIKDNLCRDLYIVTGASGVLGKEFVDKLSLNPTACVVACSRKDISDVGTNVYWCRSEASHFLGKLGAKTGNQSITLPVSKGWFHAGAPARVTLIYPVGPFEFDAITPKPPTLTLSKINPAIYGPNVIGLHNYLRAVCDLTRDWKNTKIRLVCFDSISNRENPAFWQSYSLSKRIMKRYLKSLTERPSLARSLSVLIVNTSTINTGAENSMRPGATPEERAEWLKPSEVVNMTLNELPALKDGHTKEVDIYHPASTRPAYSSKSWFDRWQRQMRPV